MYLPGTRPYGLAGETGYLDSLFPMSNYYPTVSDQELRYPYRVRSPLALAGFPYTRPASRRLPPWYSALSPALRREPWWYEMPMFRDPYAPRGPNAYRNSFLSPIKRTFVWSSKPLRNVVRW